MSTAMPWAAIQFRGGHVTRAFDDWRAEEKLLRAFGKLGLEFADEGYERRWSDIAHQPSDGQGPDMFDLMDEATDGLTGIEYEQMHLSGTLRDGVTIFELYFERALAEMLEWQMAVRLPLGERSPRWDQLAKAWLQLAGLDIDPPAIRDIRARRHWLTHQRGELRTDRQREQYDTKEFGLPDIALRLTKGWVETDLDELAGMVVEADLAAYSLSWGRARASGSTVAEAVSSVGWGVVARADSHADSHGGSGPATSVDQVDEDRSGKLRGGRPRDAMDGAR